MNHIPDTIPGQPVNPFASFWMGGFECADMRNRHGDRVNLLRDSGHLHTVHTDYANLASLRMHTVREGICWSTCEPTPYHYNWDEVDILIRAGIESGTQQLWDLCHFGFPDDLTPLHPHFTKRFVSLALAFVDHYRQFDPAGLLIITPVNEVSFLSWLGGEVGATDPYCVRLGWEVKYALTKAFIAAALAMKQHDARVLIMSTEPLVDIVPPPYATDLQHMNAATAHEDQFQVTDMICGRMCPELGGEESLLDIMGLNFYYSNRYSGVEGDVISWINEFNDSRFRPLHQMLLDAYQRYSKPFILAETSHPGGDRLPWLQHIGEECGVCLDMGLPLWGVCWYPIIDRPDWDDLSYWHQSGFWDLDQSNKEAFGRHLHAPLVQGLQEIQERLRHHEELLFNN